MSWLAHECSLIASTNNYDLIPFMLPSIFFIAEQATEKEYATSILPHLIPIFAMRSPHQVKKLEIIYYLLHQIPLMLLQRMELLLSKTPEDDVRKHVLPLVYNALDSDASKVQVKVLR